MATTQAGSKAVMGWLALAPSSISPPI